MATLAEQLEDALRGQGTTIAPGTLSPVNVGTNQLSWSDTFDRIQQRKPLKPGEGLPTVPQGVPASTFYRQATQLGAMPSGASQFFVKPLAPETPTYDYAQQATSTPFTTQSQQSSLSSSRQLQNVIQQVQDEQLGDDSSGEGLYDYAQPVEEYDIGAKVQNFVASINPFADPNVDEFGELPVQTPEELAKTFSQVPSSSRLLSLEDYLNQDKITIENAHPIGMIGKKDSLSFMFEVTDKGYPMTIREDNFEDSVKKVYDTLTLPFEKAGEYINETIQDFKDRPWTTLASFGVSAVVKNIFNSTPLGMMASTVFKRLLDDDSSFAQSQIGRSGIVNGTGVPDSDGNYNPQSTSIAGYNSLGMAIDKDGNLVLIDGMYAWDSFGSFMNSFGISDKEARRTSYDVSSLIDYAGPGGDETTYTDKTEENIGGFILDSEQQTDPTYGDEGDKTGYGTQEDGSYGFSEQDSSFAF